MQISTLLAIALGGVLCFLVVALAYHTALTWEVNVGKVTHVSARTRDILADTQGSIRITCFMDRRHPMFRPVSRLLRGLRQASRSVAGADIVILYVDPRWDLARAGQLAALEVPENALLLERQRRRLIVTLDEMVAQRSPLRTREELNARDHRELGVFRGESVCAAAFSLLS